MFLNFIKIHAAYELCLFFSRVHVYWPEFNGIRLKFLNLSKSLQSNCSEYILKYAYALLPFRSRPRMQTPAKQTLWCLTLFTTVIFTFITYYKSPAWLVNVLKNHVSALPSLIQRAVIIFLILISFFFLFAFLSIYYPIGHLYLLDHSRPCIIYAHNIIARDRYVLLSHVRPYIFIFILHTHTYARART